MLCNIRYTPSGHDIHKHIQLMKGKLHNQLYIDKVKLKNM